MSRIKRVQHYRDNVNEEYFLKILDFVEKNKDKEGINNLISNYQDLKLEWFIHEKIRYF